MNAILLCRGGLDFPADLSPAAVDLLKSLLHRDANERLGAGPLDAEEIKVCLSAFFRSCVARSDKWWKGGDTSYLIKETVVESILFLNLTV